MLISRKDVSDYLEKMGKNSEGEILKLIHEKLPIESLGILKIDHENKNIFNWIILMRGPNNTPYENGLFRIRIIFSKDTRFEDSPFKPFMESPPQIQFLNQIYHLHVNPSNGNICILMLFKWERDTSIVELLVMLYLFFIFDQIQIVHLDQKEAKNIEIIEVNLIEKLENIQKNIGKYIFQTIQKKMKKINSYR